VNRSALLLLAVVSCASEATTTCPGEPVARFAFEATAATTATPLPAGLDPDPAVTDCAAALGFSDTLTTFAATLSHDPDGSAGALCRTGGRVLYGTRTATRWDVEAASDGAVLGACSPTCVARSRTVIVGDVSPDADAPTSFGGALIEQLSPRADCGSCALPCAKRYVLTGAPEAQP
jgi:hypothetical protein